ncbi:unnamed protein product, partial [Rotaria magnacalcarata]
MSQYDRCSWNSACAYFHVASAPNTGICTDRFVATRSELVSCEKSTNVCNQSDHRCVRYPQWQDYSVYYSISSFNQQFCPPILTTTATTVQQP